MKIMEGLLQCPANNVPLTPISFLERAASVFGNKPSIIYGNTRYTWRETRERCLKLASALTRLKISRGDIVAAMAADIPALHELHFAVPMAGATLSALNVSIDEHALTIILQRFQPKVIFVDSEFAHVVSNVINNENNMRLQDSHRDPKPLLVAIHDVSLDRPTQCDLEVRDYEQILATGESDFQAMSPAKECDPISVNFTSGSTGTPKAVAYRHRAAYLDSLGLILQYDMGKSLVFLWTLDMHRCNEWCFTWAMAAVGGVNVCIQNVSGKIIFDSIQRHKVTHLCGDHTILNLIAECPPVDQKPLTSPVRLIISGAIPTNHFVKRVQVHGFQIISGYGMTEALGPALINPGRSSQHHHHDDNDDDDHDDPNLEFRVGLHTTTTSASHVGASPTRSPLLDHTISVEVDRSPPTNGARSTATAGSPQARTTDSSRPGPSHQIVSLFQRQKLGKEVLRFVVSVITGLLLNQQQGFNHPQAGVIVLALCIGFTTTWNGVLLGGMYPRLASALECFGIASVLVACFGMVSYFLPPSLVWACWLCCGLSFSPFFLCLVPPKADEERAQRGTAG